MRLTQDLARPSHPLTASQSTSKERHRSRGNG